MAGNEVILPVKVDTSQAQKGIKTFTASSVKAFAAFGAAAVAAGAAVAGALALRESIAAARRQESAVQSVATAMGRLGEFSQDALKDMKDFASELQNVTGVGDEASLEMVALAKSFGATNKQAKLMTEASIELAAATGKSTDEAIRQVSKTLGGFAGELGEVNPAIKELTAEQLKAGEAARILINQYSGTAAAGLKPFSGAVEFTQGRFGDLLETIGDLIIKNPVVTKIIKLLGDAFNQLGTFLAANRDTIIEFINKGLISILKIIPRVIKRMAEISKAFKVFNDVVLFAAKGITDLLRVFAGFDFVQDILRDITRGFAIMGQEVAKFVGFILDSSLGSFVFKELGVDVDLLKGTLGEFQKSLDETIAAPDDSGLTSFLDDISDGLLDASRANQDFFDQISKSLDITAADAEKLVVSLEKLSKTKAPEVTARNFPGVTDSKGLKVDKGALTGIGKDIAGAMTQGGKEGATAAVGAIGAGVATFFGGGAFADIISTALQFAADENAAATIRSTIDNIPQVVEAIAENGPDIAVAIIGSILNARFLSNLATGIVRGTIEGLRDAFGSAGTEFSRQFAEGLAIFGSAVSDVINAIPGKLNAGIDNFVSDFKNAWVEVRDAILAPFQFIIDGFEFIADSISDAVAAFEIPNIGGGGGDKGPVTGIKGSPFAEGGLVPSGFPSDSFPARLTSGELVIPPGDTKRLSSFLDRADTIEALLVGIIGAVGAPMTVNTTAEVDGQGFADIMLELTRRNARTA